MKRFLRLIGLTVASSSALAAPIHFELQETPGRQVALAADFLEWQTRPMREAAPGRYVLELEEPWRPRVLYKFVVDGQWRPDPAASGRQDDGHGGFNSVREATVFREDPLLQPREAPLAEARFELADGKRPRPITVIEPLQPTQPSATLYFQDGDDYLAQGHVRELLANLARVPGVPAFLAVFVPPRERMKEYARSDAYAELVARRLVPEIERRYPATGGAPARRLMIGASMGGLISLYTALKHPDVFGLAASQSGSLWWEDGALLADFKRAAGLRFFMDCGTYESPDMLDFNHRGAEAASQAGHAVTYREYPSTHDWASWRNRLPEILRTLFAQ